MAYDRIEDPGEVLRFVYDVLNQQGYNGLDQLIGYLMTGDETYITTRENARNIIRRIEREDLVAELLKAYLQ